ncbi:bifunctional 4-hydroxy-2-oxoglutarate aldolase/2-dehydro-3-deoxy-phosphogluconate aldolase [Deinococcus sp. KSM4-11]|uniref:bifunctional 4-hydroxy-2-oxoglutarate aldolase/2-dehydro-3-deoxy-phosphogluconate aldolase n=1 Tax=Deinococcus sp. KSM4-11 TaxID=2568654 RepID=UPI0010A51E63|nr:bifunctional 4-hydroxy-2-oxoglutarate aldolase/2-dehydro-3-deoxy-phosphogluconate aldolase [Deinococcus sp. KSM4-11]THF87020.1 bifunctional 4-hydroxy-2-oxoglutarate aldolase/2-dehydro-3-deoxy-phosphogluconate aldolase [Deinococcus sp. KSM4-11]
MPDLPTLLRRHRLLAILRGVPALHAPRLIETLRAAGIALFEVALSDALGLDALKAVHAAHPDLMLGAGTILTPALAAQAQAAGASFLVTPHLVPDVAHVANENGLGLLMGALTPTEIVQALALGSAAVKVFPAGLFGPDYFQQLRGPYPDAPLLAVGGVTAGNLGAYLAAGALGAGIGGALTHTDWSAPDWASLHSGAAALVAAAGLGDSL